MHVYLLILTLFMSDGHSMHVRVLPSPNMDQCKAAAAQAPAILTGKEGPADEGVVAGVDARCEDILEVKSS